MDDLQSASLENLRQMLAVELQERKINPLFVPIVNKYLEGANIECISKEFGLQPMEVSLILDRNDVKNYCNNAIMTEGYLNRLKRVRLINKVIDKFIADAEEYEAPYSKKDPLDWIKLLQEENKMALSQTPKTAIQVNQNGKSNMLNLISDLMETE